MRKATLLAALVLTAAFGLVFESPAQTDPRVQQLEKYMKSLKNEFLQRRDATLMAIVKLEGEELKEFNAIKKRYDKELFQQARARMNLIADFVDIHKQITDAQADDVAVRYFQQEEARRDLHGRYYVEMKEKLSPVVAVQFLQVQGQFETMADMERAKYVPLAGE